MSKIVYNIAWSNQKLQIRWRSINDCAENLNFLGGTCGLCNESSHLVIRCKLFHDLIMSKNCDDLISLAHYNELSLLMGYKEMKRITNYLPEFARYKLLGFDLEEIYMYCAVNCIENPYIANYIKKKKQKMKRILMKGKRLPNILLLSLMMNQVTRKSFLFNQSHQ